VFIGPGGVGFGTVATTVFLKASFAIDTSIAVDDKKQPVEILTFLPAGFFRKGNNVILLYTKNGNV
jgi:hypothetical protein